MQPPPGSVPHPIGQGVAVAVRARAGRAHLMLVLGILLALIAVAVVVPMARAAQTVPAVTVVLLLIVPLLVLQLVLVLGEAAILRGPMLVVDDAGIRTRDLVGWMQVPWATLRQLTLSGGGKVLELDAPGGVYLNEKLLRRSRHRFKLAALETDPQQLLAYLEHRRSLAWQAVPR